MGEIEVSCVGKHVDNNSVGKHCCRTSTSVNRVARVYPQKHEIIFTIFDKTTEL